MVITGLAPLTSSLPKEKHEKGCELNTKTALDEESIYPTQFLAGIFVCTRWTNVKEKCVQNNVRLNVLFL